MVDNSSRHDLTSTSNKDLRLSNGRMIKFCSLFFLLLKASNNILYVGILTYFLKTAGPDYLPWAYLIVNASFVSFQFGLIPRIAGMEGHWLLTKTMPAAVLFSILSGFMITGESFVIQLASLVPAMLMDLVSNQSFSAMANSFLTLKESKKYFPIFFALGSTGYILSGFALKFILELTGIRGLLWLNAGIYLIAHEILQKLSVYEKERIGRESEVTSQPSANSTETIVKDQFPRSWNQPLARILNVSAFLILFNKYLIDFLFAVAINDYFNTSSSLASFMGIFGATTDFVVILLQAFAMNRIFANFPIGRVMAFIPCLLCITCAAAGTNYTFLLAVCIQFLVLINSKNFTVPATAILMGAFHHLIRPYYRRDIALISSLASTLVGAGLLCALKFVTVEFLLLITSSLYALMTLLHLHIDKAYSATLQATILQSAGSEVYDWGEAFHFLAPAEKQSRIEAMLEHPDPGIRLMAIEETEHLKAGSIDNLLLRHLSVEKDSRCLAVTARVLLERMGGNAFCHIEILLASAEDPRLISDVIEALGRVGSGNPPEEITEMFLDHEHHRVQAASVITLLRLTSKKERLESAMAKLVEMARSEDSLRRTSAAAVMSELGLPLFVPALETLAWDQVEAVSSCAVIALSKIRTPKALGVLEKLAESENGTSAGLAAASLKEASIGNIKRIGSILDNLTAVERNSLVSGLRSIRNKGSLELLSRVLSTEKNQTRIALVSLLQQAGDETSSLMDACLRYDEGNLNITLQPLCKKAEDSLLHTYPQWGDLIGILSREIRESAGDTRNETMKEMLPTVLEEPKELAAGVSQLIKNLWSEIILLEILLLKFDSFEADPVAIEKACELWKQRVKVCCKLSALSAREPSGVISAMERLTSTDSFTISLAQEIIESTFEKETAAALVILIKNSDQIRTGCNGISWRLTASNSGLKLLSDLSESLKVSIIAKFFPEGGFNRHLLEEYLLAKPLGSET